MFCSRTAALCHHLCLEISTEEFFCFFFFCSLAMALKLWPLHSVLSRFCIHQSIYCVGFFNNFFFLFVIVAHFFCFFFFFYFLRCYPCLLNIRRIVPHNLNSCHIRHVKSTTLLNINEYLKKQNQQQQPNNNKKKKKEKKT